MQDRARRCGIAVKTLGKIVRSVQAFGRELSRAVPDSASGLSSPRIGLALGGGFARGIAHVGVLKVLEEENIPIRFVAGTSVGALIGAAYCSGVSVAELEQVAARVRLKHFARWTVSRLGFASSQRMIGFLNSVLKVKTFEELHLPLGVTATDFHTGEGVVFHSGPLVDAIRASCAYPGMFLPVILRGRLLVDGMLSHAVPTVPARQMGAERVLAVELKGRWTSGGQPRHIFNVIGQSFAIAQERTACLWQAAADAVITPNVNGFKYDDFERHVDLVRAGEFAMRQALPAVKKWLAAAEEAAHKSNLRAPRGVTQVAPMPAD